MTWLPAAHWAALRHASAGDVSGRVRGVLVRQWAAHCQRRWGADAAARVRAVAGDVAATLPDEPLDKAWYPAAAQLAVTDAIIDEYLSGDAALLRRLVCEDAVRGLGRMQRLALRALGPARAYARASQVYPQLYDVGRAAGDGPFCQVQLRADACCFELTGAALFGHPTWRVLQLWAHAAALELLAGHVGDVRGAALGDDGFAVEVVWG